MNKVITINLNGSAYQLEEPAYEALRAYLDNAARQLAGNPDKDEIMADMEQAIGDKCRAVMSAYRTVVPAREIERIIAEMGPVDDGSAKAPDTNEPGADAKPRSARSTGSGSSEAGSAKRLYRIHEGAIVSGVCNGLAVYFNIDPTVVRAIFVLLAFITFGGAVVAYFVLVLLLPSARTDAEKAAAHGAPSTAQEFIRRAREGYYEAAKTFHDKEAHREWKRRFKHEMRGWRHNFQQEVQTQAQRWQTQWQGSWSQHPGAQRGFWFTLSLLSLIRGAVTAIWIFAMISLLTTHRVFGLALPDGMPLWAGIGLLCFILLAFVSPLRAAHRALSRHGWGGQPCAPVFFSLWDTIVWLGFVAFVIWLADRYVPHVHEAIMNLPPALHDAADSVKQWWARQ